MCALANLASNTQASPRTHTLAQTRGRTRAFARAGGALGGACSLPGLPLDAAGPLVEAALDDAGGDAFAIATLPGLCAWVAEQLARNGCGLKVWVRADAGRGGVACVDRAQVWSNAAQCVYWCAERMSTCGV